MTDKASSKWSPIRPEQRETEKIAAKGTTYMQNVIYLFSRRKSSVISLIAVVLIALTAIIGPFLTGKSYDFQNLSHVNTPPLLSVTEIDGSYYYITSNQKLAQVSEDGILMDSLPRIRDDSINKRFVYEIDGATYYLSYRQNPPVLEDSEGNILETSKTVWNKLYPLGADALGRDIFTRLLYGTRISLIVAFIATLVNLVIGVFYGSVAGYAGGNVDMVMMRIVDIISSIPMNLYVILLMVLFNNGGLISIIIALGIVYWVDMARVVRSQILSVKEEDFVLAARTMGSSSGFILRKHLIVNCIGPITVTATMQIPSAIFTEAFMSFIGLGVTAPMASLGTMCNDALETLYTAPYQLFFPAATICLIMFAFNFIGDGLRDAFDPRMRR
ncbi:MAG: ABC transporter permease [Oscillospiraceae bacterium]